MPGEFRAVVRDPNTNGLFELNNKVYVGAVPPEDPNKEIWFDTSARIVKINKSGVFSPLDQYKYTYVTSLQGLPNNVSVICAEITENQQLSFVNPLPAGSRVSILVRNTSTEDVHIVIPNTYFKTWIDYDAAYIDLLKGVGILLEVVQVGEAGAQNPAGQSNGMTIISKMGDGGIVVPGDSYMKTGR
jgi:hypothetical protein